MEELQEINRQTRLAYDLAASKYHELFRNELDGKPYDRWLLDHFAAHFAPASIVHDLGCGPTGDIGCYLHRRGLHVIGSDISPRSVGLAFAGHPDMEFMVMDMTNLALHDRSADGVVSYYSVIHTPKRFVPALLQEMHRVLKSAGKLLLAVKEDNREGYLDEFLGFRTRIYFAHFRKDEIARLLSDHGFAILFLEVRAPLPGEIPVRRIFAIAEKN